MTFEVKVLNQKIRELIEDLDSLQKVAVAVSGGPDSLFLLFILRDFLVPLGIEIVALTVNHNLRLESSAECKELRSLLIKEKIVHYILLWEHSEIRSSIQSKARTARYRLLLDYCKDSNINHLFIGHHYEDNAETVMLNILRGTGISGLAGIPSSRKERGVNILRPLLEISKQQILDYLNARAIPYADDPSNNDSNFQRVQVRKLFASFPIRQNMSYKLNLLSYNARRAKEYLDKVTKKTFKDLFSLGKCGEITVSADNLQHIDDEILYRLFNLIFRLLHNKFCYPVRLSSLLRLGKAIKCNNKLSTTLLKCRITREKNTIYFFRERQYVERTKALSIGTNLWDNRFNIIVKCPGLTVAVMSHKVWSIIKKEYSKSMSYQLAMTSPIILDKFGHCVHHIAESSQKTDVCIEVIKYDESMFTGM
jgi:tRNA(Ile)-lysidine synthase